ncbi:PAS domain S-box protein [Gemmata sp. JC673]|uniref:histidine kinase n=1 Tax=Gemmata algarum TaxID=2975278 RepID=A0ABU5EXS8_9BACT|nr:PAS domain S-box protein [Gemmata algarum]MDY3560118.1 PAS domain S-box protein [Gemmata algarum]
MQHFWLSLFDTSDFPARWRCGNWDAPLGWLHILSDLGVWSAYLAIPIALVLFARRRKDVPFRNLFWLFSAFILLCGTTHLIEAIIFWWPAYRLAGLVKLATAVVSWTTVLSLLPVIPKAFAMRSPEELEREVAERRRVEAELRASEERFRAAMNGSLDAVFFLTAVRRPDGLITDFTFDDLNPAGEHLVARTRAETVGQRLCEMLPVNRTGGFCDRYARVVVTREPLEEEFPFQTPEGAAVWLQHQVVPLGDGIVITSRDITARKQAELELRASEERLRSVVESATDAIITTDRHGLVVGWNRGAERVFGCPADAAAGSDITRIIPARYRAAHAGRLAEYRSGQPSSVVGRVVAVDALRRDGTEFPAELTVTAWEAGGETFFTSIVRDVTASRRAAEAVARSERYYRTLFEHAHDPVLVFDPDGERVLDVNPAACRVYGLSREEFVGRSLADLSADPAGGLAHVAAATDGREVYQFETVQFRRDGARLELEVNASVVEFDGRPAVLSVNRDVTERNRAEARRAERERAAAMRAGVAAAVARGGDKPEVLRACCAAVADELGAALVRVWVLPEDGAVLELRASAGLTASTDGPYSRIAVGRLLVGRIAEERKPYWTNAVADDPLTGEPERVRGAGLVGFAGHPLLVEGRLIGVLAMFTRAPLGAPARDALGGAADLIAQFVERRRAEEGMRLRDRALAAFPQGVAIADATRPDHPLVYVNPGFERITGYPAAEALGRNCRFLQGKGTDPSAVAAVRAALRDGRPALVELLNYRKDGKPFWNALTVAPVRDEAGALTHFVAIQTDVSPLKQLEAQLLQSQKMEAVGQLAGGVAHDFNNLLTVILGFGGMLGDRLAGRDRTLINEIVKAGERAAGLTRQLLAFSRQEVIQPRPLSLNVVVAEAERLLRRLIGEDIELATVAAPDLAQVVADPGQAEQVLMNLVVNARDAMPTGGRLTVETRNVERDGARHVLLSVTDTGCGMSDEVKSRLFEPFFTTKGAGRGTGLGLAVVHGVVEQAGGRIEVDSAVGRGTTFRVYFPAAGGGPGSSGVAAPLPAVPDGTETVLLVEDDAEVRALAREVLRERGYTVLEAPGAGEALQTAAAHRGPLPLLVTDVVMPGMGGRQLAEALQWSRPGLRVLYVSGYTDDAVVRHGVRSAEVAFLQKPFTAAALARKVRAVLDG